MNRFQNRIITASAGTGKTYRLSLEFISILISYYEQPGFEISSILVLTFTRKATAEIRLRILEQLRLLAFPSLGSVEDRLSLLDSLCKINTGIKLEDGALQIRQQNYLLSAYYEISSDRQILKVMTIDSYISAIFRNLVRPQRSIDTYEIDIDAPIKRMSEILNHLMTPQIKPKVDKLLRRRISPSLDEYAGFFESLIKQRWIYYLLTKRLDTQQLSGLQAYLQEPYDSESALKAMLEHLSFILERIKTIAARDQKDWQGFFVNGFKALFDVFADSATALLEDFTELSRADDKLYKFLNLLSDTEFKGMVNNSRLRKGSDQSVRQEMGDAQSSLRKLIANHLLHTLLLAEQQEILGIWEEVLKTYDRLLYKYRSLSYDDISWFSFEALYSFSHSDPDPEAFSIDTEFYEFLSYRSRFILIDEFQDTSLIQFNILKPIIEEVCSGYGEKDFGGLIVVGDEKQSIFGWRGGERDLLLRLDRIIHSLGEPANDKLSSSYRSSPHLMSLVNAVFSADELHSFLRHKSLLWDYSPVESMKPKLDLHSKISFIERPHSTVGDQDNDIEAIYGDFVETMIRPALKEDSNTSIAILCRRTKDLAELQLILESHGITGVFEPSAHLLLHPLVSPLIAWLKYLAFGEPYSLLAFLRSDYILIPAAPLKAAIDYLSAVQHNRLKPDDAKPTQCPALLSALEELASESRSLDLHGICLRVVNELLDISQTGKRDLLNLNAFLGIAAQYSLSGQDLSITDFISYLEDNIHQEFMRQRSLSENSGLQLLTIHKSKGLQFTKVFVFYNLSAGKAPDFGKLNHYVSYKGDSYHHVEDFALSLNYDKLITSSDFSYLAEAEDKRALLEEMNTLYVAFTRAVSSLGIYFTYRSKDGWADYYASKDADKLSLPAILCNITRNYMIEQNAERIGSMYSLVSPSYSETEKDINENKETRDDPPQTPVFDLMKAPLRVLEQTDEYALDLKKIWLEDRSGLMGDLAHLYLSGLIRFSAVERRRSLRFCYQKFGSLMPQSEIDDICSQVDSFCESNPDLFALSWDKVFTEKNIWHKGRELRIDRLMVDTAKRQVLILDYKTGGLRDKKQLETYKAALQELPWIKQAGYEISYRYMQIKLSL